MELIAIRRDRMNNDLPLLRWSSMKYGLDSMTAGSTLRRSLVLM
jgi:hypothetical protein